MDPRHRGQSGEVADQQQPAGVVGSSKEPFGPEIPTSSPTQSPLAHSVTSPSSCTTTSSTISSAVERPHRVVAGLELPRGHSPTHSSATPVDSRPGADERQPEQMWRHLDTREHLRVVPLGPGAHRAQSSARPFAR